jgi:transmembrane sensor
MSASSHVDGDSARIEAEAAAWLEQQNFAPWSDADQAQFDAWLSESLSHRVAYWRLESAWSRTGRLTALRAPIVRQAEKPVGQPRQLFRIAASAIVVVATGYFGFSYFAATSEVRYSTGVGEHKVLQLSDGSRVELNTRTSLRVFKASGARKVWLDSGEAYFDVRHDAARPFTVLVGNRRITDLGTKFAVRKDAGEIKVSLTEGKARVDAADSSSAVGSAVLAPGDVALATPGGVRVLQKPVQELRNELDWRRGMLVFVHATLADVAKEFNRYNTTRLVIADPIAAKQKIGATFPAQGINDFAALAQTVLGLRVQRRANEIVITR